MAWWQRGIKQIIWTNADLLQIGSLGIIFNETLIKMRKNFVQEKCIWNVICEKAAILYRPQYVKYPGAETGILWKISW